MSREALKQSLITEAAIQSKDHPSKDARTFAKSVHEYLMAEQPAQTDWEAVAADQALTIALLKAEQPAPVQQRLKLVPYEPSIDMQEHGSIASGYDLSQTRAKKVYQAMIDMHDVMMEREPTDEWFRLQAGYPEQPAQQEPVAWVCEGSSSDEKHAIDYWPGDIEDIPIGTKLYTSPPAQRKPLTDEQVTDGCRTLGVGAYRTLAAAFEEGVRFAEAAHGIKENT